MQRLWTTLVVLGCLAALTFACYGSAIVRGEQFAYRDAAHFYYPLYERVQNGWKTGHYPPLWETEENAGMPLLGNPTAAVLYPGKAIFAVVPYPLGVRIYTIAHTLLAFAAMLALLRSWNVSWPGSTLSALSYAFGAPILFQYCNIIFLVGAAWAPLGIRAVDRWLRLGRRWALLELAVVLAMETLGGDPETAYLTGVCAGVYASMLAWSRRKKHEEGSTESENQGQGRGRVQVGLIVAVLVVAWVAGTLVMARYASIVRPPKVANNPPLPLPWMPWVGATVLAGWTVAGLTLVWRSWRRRNGQPAPLLVPMLAGLLGAAALAVMLSAAQLFPVLEFTSLTSRAAGDGPHDIYPFSLPPIRLVELIWPHPFGLPYHGNKSWIQTISTSKSWVPSLYLGGLTMVLGLGALRLGRGTPHQRWLSLIAAASVALSLGEFGSPLYLARFSKRVAAEVGPHDKAADATIRFDRHLRDGDGSPYWFLATGLPGFRQFRFPSKFLTFATLALAALAGQGWDALMASDRSQRRRSIALASGLLGLTLVAGVAALWFRPSFMTWLANNKKVNSFGPEDVAGCFAQLEGGLAQAAVVLAAALALALRGSIRPRLAGSIALVCLTADLAAANAPLILTAPQRLFETNPKVLEIIRQDEAKNPWPSPYRVHRMPIWTPYAWLETPSPDRARDFLVWERDTLQPKYGVPLGLNYTLAMGTAELYDYEWYFAGYTMLPDEDVMKQLGVGPKDRVVAFPRRSFDLWTTRYFVVPFYANWTDENRGYASFLENTRQVYPTPDMFSGPNKEDKERDWMLNEDFKVLRNLTPYPRGWVVHSARPVKPVHGLNRTDREAPMMDILFSNDLLWHTTGRVVYDPKAVAWVEQEEMTTVGPMLSGRATTAGESAPVTTYDAERVEIDAVLETPGLVVLADVYYPGWELTIDGVKAPIYRVNRLMRGAVVPSGKHHLVYTYRPLSFRLGLAVSVAGFAILGLLALVFTIHPVSVGIAGPDQGERPS